MSRGVVLCVLLIASPWNLCALAAEGRHPMDEQAGKEGTEAISKPLPPTEIAVLSDVLPGCDRDLASRLARHLRQAGFPVSELSASDVCDPVTLSPARFFAYVIPQCRTYPAAGLEPLLAFAREQRHVLFLGGPFLDEPVWLSQGQWLNRDGIVAAKSDSPPQHRPRMCSPPSAEGWLRTTSHPATPGSWDVVEEGPQGQATFRFWTQHLAGWDGYLSTEMSDLFGPQHGLLSFLVKGGPQTRQLVVELQERDGSRWMAVVDIGPHWQRVGLAPFDFQYWRDSSTRGNRGGAGDRVHPEHVHRIGFQLAFSHTSSVAPGEHTFWITEIGTSEHPLQNFALADVSADTSLETIFPRYKVYELNETMSVRPTSHPDALDPAGWGAMSGLVCGIPRTSGQGSQRERKWRYVPLLEAVDERGQGRGSPAWLLLNHAVPYGGSLFACLGVNDPVFLQSPAALDAMTTIVTRLRDGVFLQEAGAAEFAYWPHEDVQLGAQLVNCGSSDRTVDLRMAVRDQHATVVFSQTTSMSLAMGEARRWEHPAIQLGSEPATYTVSTELLHDNAISDRVDHEIHVLDTGVPQQREFITVQGNHFYRDTKHWYPVGVNYWPLYVSGMDHDDFWAGWLQSRYYDPELVEHDLARLTALGVNLVSIQAPDPRFYRNLLDFVHRCRRHDIYVNLFCGLASPLAFREEELKAFIETARLADNPGIMAYDTIWEPGNYVFQGDQRQRWDEAWRDWVVEQYGSVAAAEADWGVTGRRDDEGRLISPPDQHFRDDGPWRTAMAAYRRFMDDLTSRLWNRAHRKLRALDPNHLVSFRQGNTLPHDFVFTGTPKHVDFICPEGYAIVPGDEGYYVAGFITRYVHFTTGGKPIVWSEFGQSVWNAKSMSPSPIRIEEVSQYHDMFYRMVLESGANGTIPWWWPGGYRVDEKSDFGILNPDGTPRPAAQLIAAYGPELKKERPWPAATAWFDMDRDAHAGGYWYTCFNTGRDAYRHAVEAGQQLGIRTAGTGTHSATTPVVAIGNRPHNGTNPPKFLNAEFNWLLIQDAGGQWIEAEDGRVITVPANRPVKARVCVGNTQEATWLAPQGTTGPQPGDVVLSTTDASELQGQWPLPHETPYLADADFGEILLVDRLPQSVTVELRLAASGRAGFGEKRTFRLQVAD